MRQFKKILVPVDFSSCSQEAVRTAAGLAELYDAEVCLAHVAQSIHHALPPRYPLDLTPHTRDVSAAFDRRLAEAKREAEAAGISRVRTERLEGVPATEIVHLAEKEGFDLIVMGTHGRTGFSHALIGSVTERVVRTAPCAVLSVRAAAAPD